ncbi:MAG TPA: polyphosphate kinase 2 family protein [Terriglobales bacterium]|nr:polyphosphate kinase 2 family protein [Terriglobales bacterium]
MSHVGKLAKPYRVEDGKRFRLRDFAPTDTGRIKSKQHAATELGRGIDRLCDLQDKLHAQHQWTVLLIFQAMDAAGKDGTIKHVMSGVNPAGCEVYSFKAPSGVETYHDYMWRTTLRLPECGRTGIFNRSYYEEVLVVRVHGLLKQRQIPPSLIRKHIWEQRFDDICAFERFLCHNGVVIRKFFLNLSKAEQSKRFLKRLQQPQKHWKFSASDIKEREYGDDYMVAYEDMIRHTATPWAPWYVVPADHKWFTRMVVAAALVDTLEELDLSYPKVDVEKHRELENVRQFLKNGKS